MRTLVWSVTGAAVALWSGLAWLTHAAIGLGGDLAARNADLVPADPQFVEWMSWLALLGSGIGGWLVIAIWTVVSAGLVALGFIVSRLLPRQPRDLATN